MISFDAALEEILRVAKPLGVETVAVEDALNRYLAADLHSAIDSPLFDNSAVDGFAVRACDVPGRLRVSGVVYAGDASGSVVEPGTTVRVMTGAMVPAGADAMVMQEDVVVDGEVAEFSASVVEGQAIRKCGEEYRAGELLIKKGTKLTPEHLGLIAAQGLATVDVGSRPSMAVIVTGSELLKAGDELLPGRVYESNSVALVAKAQTLGVERPTVRSVADDEGALGEAFLQACEEADIVVFSGGASVGEKDLVRRVCLSCGVEEVFWRINMKPGKPVFFGRRGLLLVFALPGNPVSALVTFFLLVGPAVRQMSGAGEARHDRSRAVLGSDLQRVPGRLEFVRGVLHEGTVTPLVKQGSHMASGLAMADSLILVSPEVECLNAGCEVEVVRL